MKKKRNTLRLIWISLFSSVIVLAGCQSVTHRPSDAALPAHTLRACGESFTLSGRVSLNYTLTQSGRTESLHGKFTWKQSEDSSQVALFSPLGQTMALIEVRPELAVFYAPGKEAVSAFDADELLLGQIGWPLPISGLRHWLLGCMTEGDGTFLQASPLNPNLTTSDGWSVRYERWMPFGEDQLVPRRIDMSHTPLSPAPITAIHIRLVADEWAPSDKELP